jgi:hypothetical protein
MQAKIFAIGKSIDESNRSISIHAEMVDDQTELIPGMDFIIFLSKRRNMVRKFISRKYLC